MWISQRGLFLNDPPIGEFDLCRAYLAAAQDPCEESDAIRHLIFKLELSGPLSRIYLMAEDYSARVLQSIQSCTNLANIIDFNNHRFLLDRHHHCHWSRHRR